MINSRSDYLNYRNLDGTRKMGLYRYVFDDISRFMVVLRKAEYYNNVKSFKLLQYYYRWRLKCLGIRLGFTIPLNACGPGLSLPHRGTIVINPAARVGANCRIHVCVNIGATGGKKTAPIIGDGVYIGPGAKIYGNITIADGIAVGANAVVNKSCLESGVTLAGVPAGKIGSGGARLAGWMPK